MVENPSNLLVALLSSNLIFYHPFCRAQGQRFANQKYNPKISCMGSCRRSPFLCFNYGLSRRRGSPKRSSAASSSMDRHLYLPRRECISHHSCHFRPAYAPAYAFLRGERCAPQGCLAKANSLLVE